MPSFGKRIFSLFDRYVRRAGNASVSNDPRPFDWEWDERKDQYQTWDKLWANTILLPQNLGGMREIILRDIIGRDTTLTVNGYYSPVETIVAAYQNVFRGVWGRDIWATTPDNDEFDPESKLYQTLSKVWRWSNLDTSKQVIQHHAALYGTVGLRVVASPETKRVRISYDHPGRIVDFDEDDEGNVTAVLLEYDELAGALGRDRHSVRVREELTARMFTREVDGKRVSETENALGICPYVIMRHRDIGAEYGVPAFYGSENILHLINWRISRQDRSIDRNGFPRWFGSGAGNAPTEVNLGEDSMVYVKTMEGQPPPALEPLVPNIKQGDNREFWVKLIDLLKGRQPELALGDIEALSGQSGETIAKLLVPAATRVLEARALYEDAFIRGMKIAMGWMSMLSLADIGIGASTQGRAASVIRDDAFAFTFNARSALPETPYDLLSSIEADTKRRDLDIAAAAEAGDDVSHRERLRIMGYGETEIDKILKEKREQDVVADGDDDDDDLLVPEGVTGDVKKTEAA